MGVLEVLKRTCRMTNRRFLFGDDCIHQLPRRIRCRYHEGCVKQIRHKSHPKVMHGNISRVTAMNFLWHKFDVILPQSRVDAGAMMITTNQRLPFSHIHSSCPSRPSSHYPRTTYYIEMLALSYLEPWCTVKLSIDDAGKISITC